MCTGYTEEPFHLQLGLMLLGGAITAGLLRETLFVARSDRGAESGKGRGGGGGRSSVGGERDDGAIRMSHLEDSTFAQCVDRDDRESGDEGDEAGMLGGSAKKPGPASSGRRAAADRADGGEVAYSVDDGGEDADQRSDNDDDDYDDDTYDESGGVRAAPTAGSGADETLLQAFIRTSFRNRSLAVVCLAGFCANFETGMAWGLIASWARDGIRIGGRERDFFTGCYSFLKGFSQLVAGMISDRIGRRAPMSAGLIGGAVALVIAATGAGFHGRVLIGLAPVDDIKELQFGYLVLSGVLLGLSTGLMYPVLAAAAADHAPEGRLAGTIGTVSAPLTPLTPHPYNPLTSLTLSTLNPDPQTLDP
jgi:hypothetical protein